MTNDPGGQIGPTTVDVKKIHTNVAQEVIAITVDKMRLILQSHVSQVERKKDWIAPLGIFITLLVVLPTTTFQDYIFKPEVWRAMFNILIFLDFLYLIYTIGVAFRAPGIEDVIERMKKGE